MWPQEQRSKRLQGVTPGVRPSVHMFAQLLGRGAACFSVFVALLLLAAPIGAQKESEAEKVLIGKAQALEARGRPDIAVQVWQQILLSDPNNALALEGVARDYRLSGNSTGSDEALDKLRRINPADPAISKIQGLTSNKSRDARLAQAGALAKAGNPDAAMRIYREYYGDHPPDGDIALAYYETLYSTTNGKAEGLSAMRAAAARNPGDPRFIVTLGRMLTYDPKTRAEGIKILREHSEDSDAQNSLRQALIWDSANPTSAAELREYLKNHPKDTELESRLTANESKLAEMNAGIARTPAEKAAFAALNAHRLVDAEGRFMALLDKDEKNSRAAAGMGFLRMQQNNFAAAISYLSQAEQNGFKDHAVAEALATSRFWFTMGEANAAMGAEQLDLATSKYKAALQMRPRSPEALNGLAGVYTQQEKYADASVIYQQLLKLQPGSVDAWRGLFLSAARDSQNPQAMSIMARFPPAVKAKLNSDPDFLRTLAAIYQSQGHDVDAQRVLAEALALPFPENGAVLKTGTRLQYAGILMQAKRYDQAAELYKQVLNDDTSNLAAWMGLVTADHQMSMDNDAIALVEKMPPDTYEAALTDPGFLIMLGSIYQQSNQFEIAQGLLERAAKLQTQAGGEVSLGLQIQLASIYLQRNNTTQAYDLYRQILQTHPDNLNAWRGLIGTLQLTNRNSEAIQQIKLIPPDIRKQLEEDVLFEQSEASIYAVTGDTVNAFAMFNRVQKYYHTRQEQEPADVAIQSAYVLYNTKNDRALYPVLMNLGAREDLTDAQRKTLEALWANWSVRRAAAAFDAGNSARAIDILDAAAQAFPDNLEVRKAVAGGYLRAGRAKDALAIFKQIDLQDASSTDFGGAIGAALAATDKVQAEEWLRQALERFPHDAAILGLAARFETARGDNARAADYWRASLAAMPEVSPADKLAHELVYPDSAKGSGLATPDDLARMLNPDSDPSGRGPRSKLPPLPSYGRDPYDPSAPVVLIQKQPGKGFSTMPVYQVPTTTTSPLPSSEVIPQTGSGAGLAGSAILGDGAKTTEATSPAADSNAAPKSARATSGTTGPKPNAGNQNNSGMARKKSSSGSSYSGRMHLPPTRPGAEGSTSAGSGSSAKPVQPSTEPVYPTTPNNSNNPNNPNNPNNVMDPKLVPQSLNQPPPASTRNGLSNVSSNSTGTGAKDSGLRITSQPMNPVAARAQSQFSDQTDGQLTQGFAIHYIANATQSSTGLSDAQYTPSANDAAAGAYSAQRPAVPANQTQPPPLQAAPPGQQPAPPPAATTPAATQAQATPAAAPALKPSKKRRKSKHADAAPVPTLVTAPGQSPLPQQPVTDGTVEGSQSTTTSGLTDQELKDRNLPPLRGPWLRTTHREPPALSPREEAEMQLRTIEGGYSAWLGGTGVIAHRSGTAGYDSLTSLESQFEASLPLSTTARLTFVARPVFLDSGQADGNALTTLTSGVGPEPFGTETGLVASTTPPPQQNAAGFGGEVQLTLGNMAFAGGYTPYNFLVSNFTGRASWRPERGPVTLSFNRDSVKDTQLSYAGLRDPGSITAFFPGNIWGGVMANSGNVQYARGDLNSGYYFGAGGQYITGYHVLDNRRYEGSMGAYFRVYTVPEYGTLNVGANFFGMHYSHNLQAFTYGMGGYFSPQAYFLANVPITWTGHYGARWHYNILGSFGIQAFQLDSEPLFPLDRSIEIAQSNPSLPNMTSVGPNYDLRGQVAYALSEHWFVGGFGSANNSRNYANVSAGFSLRYLFRPQPSTAAGPTGLFQTDDQHALRPLTVP